MKKEEIEEKIDDKEIELIENNGKNGMNGKKGVDKVLEIKKEGDEGFKRWKEKKNEGEVGNGFIERNEDLESKWMRMEGGWWFREWGMGNGFLKVKFWRGKEKGLRDKRSINRIVILCGNKWIRGEEEKMWEEYEYNGVFRFEKREKLSLWKGKKCKREK